jgi:hypothetical protein
VDDARGVLCTAISQGLYCSYVVAKQQPIKEFPIEDIAQSFTNIVQVELSKTRFGNNLPIDPIHDIVKTLIKQELGKLNVSEPETVGAEIPVVSTGQ